MSEECLICKAPLLYLDADEVMECGLCHKKEPFGDVHLLVSFQRNTIKYRDDSVGFIIALQNRPFLLLTVIVVFEPPNEKMHPLKLLILICVIEAKADTVIDTNLYHYRIVFLCRKSLMI